MISEIDNQMSRICTRMRLSSCSCNFTWGHDTGGIYLLTDSLFTKDSLSRLEAQMKQDGLKLKSWQMVRTDNPYALGCTSAGMRLYIVDAEATQST
jgi:hypothetical protein